MRVIVAGNIGSYEQGRVLVKDAEIADYYRAAMNEGADAPTTLDDSEILAIVQATDISEAKGDVTDIDVLRVEALLKGGNIKPTMSALGNSIRENAWNFAKGLKQTFDKAMQAGFTAKDTTDQLPIELAFEIDAALPRGGNGKITAPFPGLPETETVKNADGSEVTIKHENPDRYVTRVAGKRVVSSYYQDALMARPEGKAINETIRQIDAVGMAAPDCEQEVTHGDGEVTTFEGFKAMRQKDRDAARARWKSRLDYGTNKLRRAAQVCFMIEAIGGMSKVDITFASEPSKGEDERTISGTVVVEKGRKLINTTKPIILIDNVVKGGISDPMSITSFLNLSPVAVGEEGTLEQLIETGQRDSKDTQTVGEKVPAIREGDVKAWELYAAETLAWIQNTGNYKMLVSALANDKLTPEFMLTIGELADLSGAITSSPKFQKKFGELRDKVQAA